MKRKRDKKYLLTIGTCIALAIFMIISLTNKETYSYTGCLGVVSPDENYCCDSKSSFSNNLTYKDKQVALEECINYAESNYYEQYLCNIKDSVNNSYIWELVLYNGCLE